MERRAAAEIILGLGIAALGAFILYESQAIRVIPIYAKVGPRDIPMMVGGILALLGLALAWQGWRAAPEARLDQPTPVDSRGSLLDPSVPVDAPGSLLDRPGTAGSHTEWMPLAVIALGLILQLLFFVPGDFAALIGGGAPAVEAPQSNPLNAFLNAISGFIPTATIVFVCTAIAFGSRRYVRDILIGLVLAIIAYVGFVHALGLNLPAGLTGNLLAGPVESFGNFIGSLF